MWSRPYSGALSSRKQPSPQSHDLYMPFHRKPSKAGQRPVCSRLGGTPTLYTLPSPNISELHGEWKSHSEKNNSQKCSCRSSPKEIRGEEMPSWGRGTTHPMHGQMGSSCRNPWGRIIYLVFYFSASHCCRTQQACPTASTEIQKLY